MFDPSQHIRAARVSVIGLGRVGLVNAACLANIGYQVAGADRCGETVAKINQSECPFYDPALEALLFSTVNTGRLRAKKLTSSAVRGADFIFCCVGTPSGSDGTHDLSQLQTAVSQIGDALEYAAPNPIIVLRSTIPPETTANMVIPILEDRSGLSCGEQFDVAFVPEFLREGTAIEDFRHANRSIIGAQSEVTFERVAQLMAPFSKRSFRTSFELAELSKLTDNAWHSTKVAFANEIGNIAAALSQDSRQLLELLCLDDKLNLSSAYLRPGFAFGGPCLPKDLNALTSFAANRDVPTPLLAGVRSGNNEQVERSRRLVHAIGARRISLVGAAFKAGTERFSGSPQLALMDKLREDGLDILVHRSVGGSMGQKSITVADLGLGRDFAALPVTSSLEAAIEVAELVVVADLEPEILAQLQTVVSEKTLLDLVGYSVLEERSKRYFGVNWGPHVSRNEKTVWELANDPL